MALFRSKTQKNKEEGVEKKEIQEGIPSSSQVLVSPRVTEKSTVLMDKHVYTFEVEENATKNEIKKAVKAQYKVDPIRVNIVNLPQKKVTRGRNVGTKGGVRKAYVYLKEGDKIELF